MIALRVSLAAVLFAFACTAEGDLAVEPGAAPIVNGNTSIGDEAVVALTTDGQHFCSGTLVEPRYVVTAAHCLPPNLPFPPGELEVFFGLDLAAGGASIAFDEWLAHPDWNIDGLGNDVGVVRLVQDAPAAPVPMWTEPITNEHRGAEIRMVGFGITSEGGTDNGLKRTGTGTLDDFDALSLQIGAAPSGTCSGDSGGTSLMDVDGTEYLVGIHSRSDCISVALDERVDPHYEDFIQPFIEGAVDPCAADGVCNEDCDDDPDCGPACEDDGVCEPECADDPDCAPICEDDGACNPECAEGADPDCDAGGDDDDGGGCAVAPADGGGPTGALLLLALALIAARRRYRSPRR